MTIGVVMNPVAGGGRLAANWAQVSAAIERHLGPFELRTTTRTGETIDLAREFAAAGVDLIVAAGGDGTVGEVVDGILQSGRLVPLGILPAGTGRDFVRNLGIGKTVSEHVAAMASGRTRAIDAGRVSYTSDDGSPQVRHFINVASLGVSGPTVRAVNAGRQQGARSGKMVFLLHSVVQLLRYQPQDVRIVLDGEETIDARIAVVAIANGGFFGGGMMVAPDAAIDDGLFDVVVFRATSRPKLIANMRLLYSGSHRTHRLVTIRRARTVDVTPLDDVAVNAALLDVDGESPGRIPARFEVLPGAVTLRA
jgi:diacylglycerol kinase (ATP)